MTIGLREEIASKENIIFPKKLSFTETEKLLYYISEQIKGEVNYDMSNKKSFIYDNEDKKSKLKLEERTIKDVKIKINENCSLSAQLYSTKEDISSFYSLKVDMLVNYNKNNLEILQFGYKVRNIAEDYFNKLLKEEEKKV